MNQESYSYTYDDNGHLTKEVYENKEYTRSSRYSYDKYGNMVECVTENSAIQNKSSFSISYQLMYFPFDMSNEEFNNRFIIGALNFDFTIEYPDY